MTVRRDNDSWLSDLRAGGARRDDALADLRAILVRGLTRAFVGRSGVDASFCEDMAQDTLLKVLDHLDTFQGKSRLVTWAMAIASRVAITELRRRHWKDVSLEQINADVGLAPDDGVDSISEAELEEDQRAVLALLRQLIDEELTDKQRTALVAELGGMPQEEIARRTGSTRNAIYKLTHDARRRLKRALETAGCSAADVRATFAS